MPAIPRISRIVIRNYRSIGACDLRPHALTWLVGRNGSGKSNLLDALKFVKDALDGPLENALNERGGIKQVRRQSSGHPRHFTIRLELVLADGRTALYAFEIGAAEGGGYTVKHEHCQIGRHRKGPSFTMQADGRIVSSEPAFPAVTRGRLALAAASGIADFAPVFAHLTSMGFYNLNPESMSALQSPQDGRLLKPLGENIASVVGHLETHEKASLERILTYLETVVPGIVGVEREQTGHMETILFKQTIAGAKHPWSFPAHSMSDGTLRALGILVALFQGERAGRPSLVCIEEPESALHPAASAAVREALLHASRTTQIFVTSHSPDLLDDRSIDADSLLAVGAEGGETFIAPIDHAAREVLKDALFTPGELLRLEQLYPDAVLVEARRAARQSPTECSRPAASTD